MGAAPGHFDGGSGADPTSVEVAEDLRVPIRHRLDDGRLALVDIPQPPLRTGLDVTLLSWYRVPVRVGRWMAEGCRDPPSSSSESTCSSTSASLWTSSPRHPESLGQVRLEEPVVPDHLGADGGARAGEGAALVGA